MQQLLAILGDLEDDRIPPPLGHWARQVLAPLVDHIRELEAKLAELDRRLVAQSRSDPICRQLIEVPGVGPVIATAFAATVPPMGPGARAFRSGRHLSAWLGLVPPMVRRGSTPPVASHARWG